jgi:hypothetical protein
MRQKGLVKLLINLKFCGETYIRSKRGPAKMPKPAKTVSAFRHSFGTTDTNILYEFRHSFDLFRKFIAICFI